MTATADQRPRVSVVVPTYNRKDLVRRAVRSALEQSEGSIEVLVVDDGSTDGTADALLAMGDARLRVISLEINSGGGGARRVGALEARGDYVAFLDSDDYWAREKLEKQLSVARNLDTERFVIATAARFELEDHSSIAPSIYPEPNQPLVDYLYVRKDDRHGMFVTTTFLLPLALAQEVTFTPDLRVNQDTDFLLRLEAAGAEVVYMREALATVDNTMRADRISLAPANVDRAEEWFLAMSSDWPPLARRGYMMFDLTVRARAAGQIQRSLGYYMRACHPAFGLYNNTRYFLIALFGARLPPVFRKLAGLARGARRRRS